MNNPLKDKVVEKQIKSVRGMRDILPEEIPDWHYFEKIWLQLMQSYGYEEIRFPLVESTALFKRSIGEVTDIVEKEMFSFQDRDNGDNLSLRPEGTAGCVRAGLENGLLYNQVRRLWYMGPMFRHERPQQGRYRQFHQVGVEAFGLEGPDIEVEHILMMARFWKSMGLSEAVTLQVNTLGSSIARSEYRVKLIEYLSKHETALDADSKRRMHTNPLRILDSKNPAMSDIINNAPKCYDHLDAESKAHFELFLSYLDNAGIVYQVNPNLVRGLDYYNRTVYEWVTDKLGAQGTVCSGGRYDGLVQQLGGNPAPGVGFAAGIERILLLRRALGHAEEKIVDAYLIHVGEAPEKAALLLAESLRDAYADLRLVVHCGKGNFKQQFKKADSSGAKIALILGEEELQNQTLGVKFLRERKDQMVVPLKDIKPFLTEIFGNDKGNIHG